MFDYDNMLANPDWGKQIKPEPPQNWNRDDYGDMIFEDEYVFQLFFKNRPSMIVNEGNFIQALYDNDPDEWVKEYTVIMSGEEYLNQKGEI